MPISDSLQRDRQLADAVRKACRLAAQAAYDNAAISGLCNEGAIEAALDAIDSLDIARLVASFIDSKGSLSDG